MLSLLRPLGTPEAEEPVPDDDAPDGLTLPERLVIVCV